MNHYELMHHDQFFMNCSDCNFAVKSISFTDSNNIKQNYFIRHAILEHFGTRKGGGVKKSLSCYSPRSLDRERTCQYRMHRPGHY